MVDWTLIFPKSLTLPLSSSSSSPSSTTLFVFSFFFLHIKTSHLFDHCYQSGGEPGGDDAKRIHCQKQCQASVKNMSDLGWGWGGGGVTETQREEHKSIALLLRS